MVRGFTNQFDSLLRALRRKPRVPAAGAFGTIMTGELFAPVLSRMINQLNEEFEARFHVIAVANKYFGGDVAVAGLLTGGDLVAARSQVLGDFVIIPKVTLKSDEPIMLDGTRLAELQAQFDVPIVPSDFSTFASIVRNGFHS